MKNFINYYCSKHYIKIQVKFHKVKVNGTKNRAEFLIRPVITAMGCPTLTKFYLSDSIQIKMLANIREIMYPFIKNNHFN